jgi:hypothetical protein
MNGLKRMVVYEDESLYVRPLLVVLEVRCAVAPWCKVRDGTFRIHPWSKSKLETSFKVKVLFNFKIQTHHLNLKRMTRKHLG